MKSLKQYYKHDVEVLVKKLTHSEKCVVLQKNTITKIKNPSNNTDFILLINSIAYIKDIQNHFDKIFHNVSKNTRIIIIYFNHLWEPILKFSSAMGWIPQRDEQNWLDEHDINNLLKLSGVEVITSQKRMLFPIYIPLVSKLINRYFAFLPIFNSFCLTIYAIGRKIVIPKHEYTVSIIIAARNEEGNIPKIVRSIPKFGTKQEIIFVEGNSKDNTWEKIINETKKNYGKDLIVKAYKQKGIGKADALRLGFSKSTGEILIIYDADRTVEAKDLIKFYNALRENIGEFINGSRLIYPMEKDAMRTLNKMGNKVFSMIFTWIFGQRFKDTLCGTKAFFKKDYLKFKRFKDDPFGDFELIFGAIENNLKVVEIPVRYKERVYGTTNINRFRHGLLLFKITWFAFKKFKAW